uniref:Uncharacterized protein n=1 Tax=Panagrolaimus sp. JU765 TaxID=591449 RepID=A0AC34RSJ3_9BILA
MSLPEDDDLDSLIPPEVLEAENNAEAMTIIRSAKRKTDENIYSEIETVQDWIQALQETDSPVFKFVLLFRLPGVCQGKDLNSDEITAIVREIPCEVISDLIMTDNADVDLCLDLTCNILEVFLPRNEADLSNLKQLQPGLNYNLINKDLEPSLFQRMIICSVQMGVERCSLDDAVSVLNQCLKLLIADVKDFPSVDLLHCIQQLIQRLISNPPRSLYLCLNATWPKDLTELIK